MKIKKFSITALASVLMLTGCATNHSSPLYSYLNASTSTTVEQVRLSDLYGEQWTEFALVCPYTTKDEVKEELGIKINTYLTDLTDDSSNDIVLRDKDGSYDWIYFNRFDIVYLCNGSAENLKIYPIDSVLEFEHRDDYGTWKLSAITEPGNQ